MNKQTQGKKNRAAGARFELKVRKDLESKGWIVDKWSNNVDLIIHEDSDKDKYLDGKLIPAKRKYRGPGIPMAIGTGFPDFVAFHYIGLIDGKNAPKIKAKAIYFPFEVHQVFGVECKSNGYLDPKEKEKCKWLLDNHIFATILIASKGKKRGEIIYKEFK